MISTVIKIKLGEILEEKGKSLYQLQKDTGVAYNALSKIKKNQVKGITFDVLEKICESLECEPADLLAIEK